MRILISLQCQLEEEEKIYCFYEGFINSLIKSGNKVLIINNAFWIKDRATIHAGVETSKTEYDEFLDIERLEEKIKDFKPELVISFNNVLYRNLVQIVNCPVVLWIIDSFSYLSNFDILKENIEKYYIFVASKEEYQFIIENKNINIPPEKVHLINWATAINSETVIQDKNISFIGTNFGNTLSEKLSILRDPNNTSSLKAIFLDSFNRKEDNEIVIPDLFKELNLSEFDYWSLIEWRAVLMIYLADLDLNIYGANWDSLAKEIPALNICVSNEAKYSLKHNQDIYNSSKLLININHSQAKTGFSWRVMDVMASNGCLVSKYSKGIKEFTKDYIDIPMFDSPWGARELCQKLLKDNKWREEIVKASQKCIQEKGRWSHRLVEMERALGLSLINNQTIGEVEFLKKAEVLENSYNRFDLIFRAKRKTKHLRDIFLQRNIHALQKIINVLMKIMQSQ